MSYRHIENVYISQTMQKIVITGLINQSLGVVILTHVILVWDTFLQV